MLLNLAHRHTHRPIPSLFSTAVPAEASPSSSSFSLFHLSVCPSLEDEGGKGKGGGRFGIGVTERERVGLEFGILRDWWSSFLPLSLPLAKEGKGIPEPKLCYTMFAKEGKKRKIRISVLASLSLTRGGKYI